MIEIEDLYQEDDEMDMEYCWLCVCGTFVESDSHCPNCHNQPPWGCCCSECEEMEDYWQDTENFDTWFEMLEEIE